MQLDTGWVIFRDAARAMSPSKELTEVIPGLFTGTFGVLRALTEPPLDDVRLYLGYSGWGAGQLEMEMAAGAWLTAPATSDVILGVSPDSMWEHVVRALGIDPSTLVAMPGIH